VFSLVEGLIEQLLPSNPKRETWAAGTQRSRSSVSLANRLPAAGSISSVLASS
jgi:hypothetical protein